MTNKLLFVTDLGTFKAYRMLNDENSSRPRLALIENFVPEGSHGRFFDRFSDEAGRFRGGIIGNGTRTYGERHNIRGEFDRRTINELVKHIHRIARKERDLPMIYLAAHKEIANAILDRMDNNVRSRVDKVLMEDLTKTHQTKLIQHFDHAESLMGEMA